MNSSEGENNWTSRSLIKERIMKHGTLKLVKFPKNSNAKEVCLHENKSSQIVEFLHNKIKLIDKWWWIIQVGQGIDN